jgi:predicted transcriptional regulator
MAATRHVRPTDSELAILQVLWDRAPCSVRDIHDVLAQAKPVGYTTVLKLLQIMTQKGLVERGKQGRGHLYRPSSSRPQTQKRLVDDLVDKAFGGAVGQLVMQALGGRKASPAELAELRRLLVTMEAEALEEASP